VLPEAPAARVRTDMFGGEERFTVPDDSPLLKPRDKDTSPERVALRQAILDDVIAKAKPYEAPVAYLMGGGGGAGKSSVLKLLRERGDVDDVPILSADDFKEAIPEYHELVAAGDTRAAATVHEESSAILKRAVDGYVERKAS